VSRLYENVRDATYAPARGGQGSSCREGRRPSQRRRGHRTASQTRTSRLWRTGKGEHSVQVDIETQTGSGEGKKDSREREGAYEGRGSGIRR
jgi:hypothetical protein